MARRNFTIDWRAKKVKDRAKEAIMNGLEVTAAEAVQHAKDNHRWANRTGTAEGSIQMRPAEESRNTVFVRWGSFDVFYFIYLELGTVYMPGDFTLQRAADATYSKLAKNIKEFYG